MNDVTNPTNPPADPKPKVGDRVRYWDSIPRYPGIDRETREPLVKRDEDGEPILDKKGKPIQLPRGERESDPAIVTRVYEDDEAPELVDAVDLLVTDDLGDISVTGATHGTEDTETGAFWTWPE